MHVTRTAAAALAAALSLSALTGLTACGDRSDAARPRTVERNVNKLEHEAQRQLAVIRQQQRRNLNPNEHLAHADPEPTSSDPRACRRTLAEAWERLGHYSDGYERYLLRQPPCSGLR